MMATAAKITIAEVEHLVEPGEIDPDHIVAGKAVEGDNFFHILLVGPAAEPGAMA